MKTWFFVLPAALCLSACSSDPEPRPAPRPHSNPIDRPVNSGEIPVSNQPAVSDAVRAAQYNEEARSMWLRKVDAAASVALFRKAVELDPQPKYQFNLCYALHQTGAYIEAKEPCQKVADQTEDQRSSQKAQVVLDDIDKRLKSAEAAATPQQ